MKTESLSVFDRYLSLWIFLAIVAGLVLSVVLPSFSAVLIHLSQGGTSIPIAIGLLVMMYPPLAKVEPKQFLNAFSETKKITLSLLLNWVIGPVLMFVLSVIFLHGHPLYMIGLILVGLSRCIAMVILWNDMARGDRAFCAALVAINAIFQMVAFSFYAYIFIQVLLPAMGMVIPGVHFAASEVVKSVLIYLGIPFALAIGLRMLLTKLKGEQWYRNVYLPRVSPLALIALLYTIVLLFTVQGASLIQLPFAVLLISIPLLLYFFCMFFISYFISRRGGVDHKSRVTLALTSSSNNFELAIAVSIAVFGVHSAVSLAAVVGPLIEVPVMLLFVRMLNGRRLGGAVTA